MVNEFTVVFEQDEEEGYIAYCLEVPGANGQGATLAAARQSVAQAIARKLEARREKSRRELLPEMVEAVEEVLSMEYPPEKGLIKLAPESAPEVIVVECI